MHHRLQALHDFTDGVGLRHVVDVLDSLGQSTHFTDQFREAALERPERLLTWAVTVQLVCHVEHGQADDHAVDAQTLDDGFRIFVFVEGRATCHGPDFVVVQGEQLRSVLAMVQDQMR
ncbi:hypothetical protein D3C74_343820 [compost metagenome]